jgi:hypothetical protein
VPTYISHFALLLEFFSIALSNYAFAVGGLSILVPYILLHIDTF